jgi:thiol-disulfide isomerase/thioredoxin
MSPPHVRERVKHVHPPSVPFRATSHTGSRFVRGPIFAIARAPVASGAMTINSEAPEDTPAIESESALPDDPEGPISATTDDATSSPTRRSWVRYAIAGSILVVGLLAASQLYLISTLNDTRDELSATRSDVVTLSRQVGEVTESVDALGSAPASAGAPSTGNPAAPVVPAGFLPRFEQGQQDTALGMRLGVVEGPDAYSGDTVSIDPADGTKRVWMVWAHWCPYCQQELPSLSALYPGFREAYPGVEIATVTSSIDPTRGNPLDEYLADQQFPFTVVVDEDLRLASQLGVNAFPFWVVTDGDGTVLLRLTGYLEDQRLIDLMAGLDEFGT